MVVFVHPSLSENGVKAGPDPCLPAFFPALCHRLAELQGVLELTDVLAALVEQYSSGAGASGRGVLGLRPALQQLCKAALDGLHRRTLGKLTSE